MNEGNDSADAVRDEVLERLQRAGWIDALIRTIDGKVTPQFNRRGRRNLRALKRIMAELNRAAPEPFFRQDEITMLFALVRSLPPIPPESEYR
jgi:hypothetical protein